jgi:hypothetical protein
MAIVKYDGKVIIDYPIAHISVDSGWNNSMCEYYPSIMVFTMETPDSKPVAKRLTPDNFHARCTSGLDITYGPDDELMKAQYDAFYKKQEDEEEAKTIRVHKVVTVVRGRKVPIGTVGDVFWMGDKGYGMGVGIRLLDGSKVFTSLKNVEVMNPDKEFEKIVLGT